MKKLIFILTMLILLCGCAGNSDKNTTDSDGDAEKIDIAIGGGTLPLLTAKESGYSTGQVYFSEKSFINYLNIDTGEERILCFDPLCDHNDDPVTTDCECPAYHAVSGFLSRILVDKNRVWFTAEVSASGKPGDFTRYTQLRCIDLDDMSLKVYLEKNEVGIYDFWKYGENFYLCMPSEQMSDNGDRYYAGGSIYRLEKNGKLTLVLEDSQNIQYELLASGEGCIFYRGKFGSGEIYRAKEDFSGSEKVAALSGVFNIRFHDDCIYYMKKTGESYRLEGNAVEGDFDTEISNTFIAGNEYALFRRKIGDDTEELVYGSMPQVSSNAVINRCSYYIDAAENMIWLTPLQPSHCGDIIWEQDLSMMQMGASGKDVLTQIFSSTSGKLVAIDCDTLEVVGEMSGLDYDVMDICVVNNRKLIGQFRLMNVDRLKELNAAGVKMNSRWEHDYYGILELEGDF
ncbi:MAG: hypothetical protein IJA85_10585 [Clostridia bacterium]|nr:hypothetical protein [Clostridia bacterium]